MVSVAEKAGLDGGPQDPPRAAPAARPAARAGVSRTAPDLQKRPPIIRARPGCATPTSSAGASATRRALSTRRVPIRAIVAVERLIEGFHCQLAPARHCIAGVDREIDQARTRAPTRRLLWAIGREPRSLLEGERVAGEIAFNAGSDIADRRLGGAVCSKPAADRPADAGPAEARAD